MNGYDCFFDGSHRPDISCAAFCVEKNGELVHTGISHAKLKSSYHTEQQALYLLLRYIQQEIKPGSRVTIHGDAQSLISRVRGKRKQQVQVKLRDLFHLLRQNYSMALKYIPRKENKTAHRLSRTEYVPPIKPEARKPVKPKQPGQDVRVYELAGTKTMTLGDIVIRAGITAPGEEKYREKLLYYQQHGHFKKNIKVYESGELRDGYISYLILKAHGVTECTVEVYRRIGQPGTP